MKTYLECIPCLLKQVIAASKMATSDAYLYDEIMKECLLQIPSISFELPPPILCRKLHDIVNEISCNSDPYQAEKKFFNQLILENYAYFEKLIDESPHLLKTAVRLSVLGNIIDLGAYHYRGNIDFIRALDRNLKIPFMRNDFEKFEENVKKANNILIFGDNAGEIVLDTFLVKALDKTKVTYVVRENPILNDATMLDAKESGMLDLCRVITNGTGYPGTVFEKTPLKLQEMFHNADVVIAKGQGNFETMCDLQHKALFFLLMVKCPVISQIIDCEVNSLVLMQR